MKRVLDTNAILYLLGGKLAKPFPASEFFMSVISEMELLSYPSIDDAALNQVHSFLAEVAVIGLTEDIRELAIGLRRQHKLKLPDAIVAATAMSLGAHLITNDARLHRLPDLTCEQMDLK